MTGSLSRYNSRQLFVLNRSLLPYGVRCSGINRNLREIEKYNLQLLAQSVFQHAKSKTDSLVAKTICTIDPSAQDRFVFFKSVIGKVRELGIRCKAGTFGPDQIDVWEAQLKDRALEKIWPRIAEYFYTRPQFKELLPADFCIESATMKANKIREFLQDHPALLNRVTYLDLMNLELTILPDEIGLFTQISILNISYNKLKILTKSINDIASLKHLYANSNRLETLLPVINNSSLVYLNASYNCIFEIPSGFEQLCDLETLKLVNNRIRILPPQMGDLKNLKDLDVSGNRIAKIPASMKNLNFIKRIIVENNRIMHRPRWVKPLKIKFENPPQRDYDLRPRKKQKIN